LTPFILEFEEKAVFSFTSTLFALFTVPLNTEVLAELVPNVE